jgi:hypothetical protein
MAETRINEILLSDSASPSIIGKGIYNGSPAFFKMFEYEKIHPAIDGLKYEMRVYNIIKTQPPYIQNYFIIPLEVGETTLETLFNRHILERTPSIALNLEKRVHELGINERTLIGVIITEDTESITLNEFIKNATDSWVENIDGMTRIFNFIFDIILEGIHILNTCLQIQHNDMHFGNILIKKVDTMYFKTDSFPLKSPFKIKMYDFDRAYYVGHPNPLLEFFCPLGEGCNLPISNRDYFVFIQSILSNIIIYQSDPQHTFLISYLNELIQHLIPIDQYPILINKIVNATHGRSWISYCINANPVTGAPSFDIPPYVPCLSQMDVDTYMPWFKDLRAKFHQFTNNKKSYYYKKYLKYKKKYLTLKNK